MRRAGLMTVPGPLHQSDIRITYPDYPSVYSSTCRCGWVGIPSTSRSNAQRQWTDHAAEALNR